MNAIFITLQGGARRSNPSRKVLGLGDHIHNQADTLFKTGYDKGEYRGMLNRYTYTTYPSDLLNLYLK